MTVYTSHVSVYTSIRTSFCHDRVQFHKFMLTVEIFHFYSAESKSYLFSTIILSFIYFLFHAPTNTFDNLSN